MPGIITHYKILQDCINLLSVKKKKHFATRSIEILFKTIDNQAAGFFGSLGPDIFESLTLKRSTGRNGGDISFFLHNGGGDRFVSALIEGIYQLKDKNTEWAASQRAYCYGYVSHLIADMMIYPFVFYYSGFPDSGDAKEHNYFREQNLLIQYHIDSFFLHYDDGAQGLNWSIDRMMPLDFGSPVKRLTPSVKYCILESLKISNPDIYQKITFYEKHSDVKTVEEKSAPFHIGYLDFLPFMLPWLNRLRLTRNQMLHDRIRAIRRKGWLYSDYLVLYPLPKKTNKAIMNSHQERWQYPSGKPGFHYESVQHLVANAVERIVDLWERIETSIYNEPDHGIIEELKGNLYTGDHILAYDNMKIKGPIKLLL